MPIETELPDATPEEIAKAKIAEAWRTQAQELDLTDLGLIGLPEELFQLTQLRHLYLSENYLIVLPEELAQLTQLVSLDLSSNQLASLPEGLGQLAQLASLNIALNLIQVLPNWLAQLRQLQELNILGNPLTSLPEWLGQLKRLESLNVSFNKLEVLPEGVGQLWQLQSLYASNNRLTVLPEWLSQLKRLQRLDVSSNQLTMLPESLSQLKRLESLNVSFNKLEMLPEGVGQLWQLRNLSVNNNQLTVLPKLLSQLFQLGKLDASYNRLTVLPECLRKLWHLESLSVSHNQLSLLPEWLGGLKELVNFDVSNNQLKMLPERLSELVGLRGLSVGNNQLTLLSENLGRLTQLLSLDASNNQLRALPIGLRHCSELRLLFLHKNPDLGLPPEVLGLSREEFERDRRRRTVRPQAILDYYFSTFGAKSKRRPLNEAKMILVGRGGAGKTSLVNRLVHSTYDGGEKKTPGIAITSWQVQIGQDKVRLNIWDFGGQEIMHATHQFFLTKRSLYLLVLNAREGEQDANVEYWLRLIESFGGDSPVLVVINKVKDHAFDLNRRGLKAKFPFIERFVQTDCETKHGLDELREAILKVTDSLKHLRDPFPESWFEVKDALANLHKTERKSFISYHQYQTLCVEKKEVDSSRQETLVSFLHDLGIVVSFRDDPRLCDQQVLDPEWVTNGIYKILNSEMLAEKSGELRLMQLSDILNKKDYPKNMHVYLLDLMRKFELCYEFYGADGHYLVPELLGKEEHSNLTEFKALEALRFEYEYNILPEGLLPRFIVRSRVLNKNLPRWRTGVVLEWEGNRALVKADVQDRRVSIVVTGPPAGRRRLLTVIRADLEFIHQSITKLEAAAQVPAPGYPGLVISYKKLQTFEAKGKKQLDEDYDDDVVTLNVGELLDGVEESMVMPTGRGMDTPPWRAVNLVYSYSHVDEELRDRLETHLKLLQRQGVINTWHDRKILAGETLPDAIDENFRQADLILLLISADFIASDYCYKKEMELSLERHAKGEALVIPIFLRACDWQDARFANILGLPKDAKPITSYPNRDEAWTDVAKGIRTVAEEMRLKKFGTVLGSDFLRAVANMPKRGICETR